MQRLLECGVPPAASCVFLRCTHHLHSTEVVASRDSARRWHGEHTEGNADLDAARVRVGSMPARRRLSQLSFAHAPALPLLSLSCPCTARCPSRSQRSCATMTRPRGTLPTPASTQASLPGVDRYRRAREASVAIRSLCIHGRQRADPGHAWILDAHRRRSQGPPSARTFLAPTPPSKSGKHSWTIISDSLRPITSVAVLRAPAAVQSQGSLSDMERDCVFRFHRAALPTCAAPPRRLGCVYARFRCMGAGAEDDSETRLYPAQCRSGIRGLSVWSSVLAAFMSSSPSLDCKRNSARTLSGTY
ncbi:hypothetical protein C8R44DRAFT_760952 [Mycena epipterygia]|nr:hypothetical protein C8R44DRAFT_760952 [Mycena epipterygia]